MLTYRDFYAGAHTQIQLAALKISCCIRGCKRSLRLNRWIDEWKDAEGWAPIDSMSRGADDVRPFLCPLHKLGLAEGRYYMSESFSGAETSKKAERRIKELEQLLTGGMAAILQHRLDARRNGRKVATDPEVI